MRQDLRIASLISAVAAIAGTNVSPDACCFWHGCRDASERTPDELENITRNIVDVFGGGENVKPLPGAQVLRVRL